MSQDDVPGGTAGPERDSRRVWWIVAAVLVLLVALRFAPKLDNPLRPDPRAAFLALQIEGEDHASDGLREIEAGRPFRLYAVLEAETLGGSTIYYTEAPALRLGGMEVAPGSIRSWPASRPARVRWQTVEGFSPYLAVGSASDLDRFRLVETFHADWGSGWSADGVVDPRLAQLEPGSPLRPLGFGTQRFAVRIELYESEESLTPAQRWSSPGPAEVLAAPERASGVIAALPSPLDVVSRAFGRTRLDPAEDVGDESLRRIVSLVEQRTAFLEASLLAAHLRAAGRDPSELDFATVELGADGPRWGSEVEAGDLVGAGDRQLVLWRDEGLPGRLDPADLAFDFHRGLRVQRIDQVFLGAEGLRLDHAPIADRKRVRESPR